MAIQSANDVVRYIANRDLLGSLPYRIGKKTITSAQLLTLRATPITLTDLPGTGFSYIPVYSVFQKQAGTAYTVAADRDIGIRYTNGTGTTLQVLETTGFIDQVTTQQRVLFGFQTAGGGTPAVAFNVTPTENAALVAHNLGAAEFATGTGSLVIEVFGFKAKTSPTF